MNEPDIVICHVPYMFDTNPPMAAPLLKACLAQRNITALALDLNIDFLQGPAYSVGISSWMHGYQHVPTVEEFQAYRAWVDAKAREVLSHDSPWIGISVFTKDSQRAAEDLALAIRLLDPTRKILLGGNGSDIWRAQWNCKWYELMLDGGLADAVLIGEGELAIIDIIEQDLRGLIHPPQLTVEQLDSLPPADFSDYDLDRYTYDSFDGKPAVPITASKGCVRNCTFCSVPTIWPSFRYRNGERVAEEMIALNRNHGFTYFRFTDSLINGSVSEFRRLNQYLTDHSPLQLHYRGQFICRPRNQMPPEDFRLMAGAGAYYVQIGIESGSESVRNHMRKKFSNDDIDYTARQLADNGIKQGWYLFVGYPTETEEDFQATLDLMRRHADLAAGGMLNIMPTGTFILIDGTPIMDDPKLHDLGLTPDSMGGGYGWTSSAHPDNTFHVRAERFRKLLELGNELNMITDYENMVAGYKDMIEATLGRIDGGHG